MNTQKICKCDVAHQTHITLIPQIVLVATSKTVFVTSGVWDQGALVCQVAVFLLYMH